MVHHGPGKFLRPRFAPWIPHGRKKKKREKTERERFPMTNYLDYDDEPQDYDGDGDFDDEAFDFADPGGRSALRAATAENPRNLPCPSCGAPNRLTPKDVALGYQCDACADRDEGCGP